jgi:riboflavin kinase / FMN adenylyltransferase
VWVRNNLEALAAIDRPLHLALGVFDGVHLGHRAVITAAVRAAETDQGVAGVVTFDPHPIRVIAPQKAPSALLATLAHKAKIMGDLGVELFVPLTFDRDLAATPAEDFIDRLLAGPVRSLAVGEDWRFGQNRGGDVEFLRQRARQDGFRLIAVPPVMLEGERISSTRIRQAIRDGNLEAAARMIGRPYSVSGPVVKGQELGRTLGFPTANVATAEAQLPPDGVWAVSARQADGPWLDGVANLGVRPTVDGNSRLLEVHLLDFAGDLYGRDLEVEFREFLRPENRFNSLEELRLQIAKDVEQARISAEKNAGS